MAASVTTFGSGKGGLLMIHLSFTTKFLGVGLIALNVMNAAPAMAQTGDGGARTAEFTAESAIVDTAIPFAIGASEARQSLRGAFGWPTFQEGLVEGVYFRFDPDGYARFSPNPRLDVDVFEVLCKARTKECHARKAGLTVILTPRGQLQITLEGVIGGDSFFLSEGVSEIQVPERVLQPLDVQMENLLASSLELVVRRGGEEVSRHSLRGFLAATAYLRWITNNQDYAVLPRDWPVPNGRQVTAGQRATQNANWQSPMPQPQVIAITPSIATPNPVMGLEADRIDAQLQDLRDLLQQLRSGDDQYRGVGAVDAETQHQTARVEELLLDLSAQVQGLQEAKTIVPVPDLAAQPDLTVATMGSDPMLLAPQTTNSATDKLAYLVEELGLDLRSAVAVLELAEAGGQRDASPPADGMLERLNLSPGLAAQGVDSLLNAEIPQFEAGGFAESSLPPGVRTAASTTVTDYLLLSDYFRSAALPVLLANPPR
ncbi:hypothetical protein [Thalassobius sp. Cn5-15]|uniref:hypothetical protein n=1 Tax=Thalassobius sp. Cn5-15 TaxID=2917763 RepID=UPI001EF34B50|nr:hypothetical protein [Thalassobius sp. Cn5-15]MCG7494626.1 hypothetical protein [Thalassobius sp. Cn5-15]